jgi:hypothetical protein
MKKAHWIATKEVCKGTPRILTFLDFLGSQLVISSNRSWGPDITFLLLPEGTSLDLPKNDMVDFTWAGTRIAGFLKLLSSPLNPNWTGLGQS